MNVWIVFRDTEGYDWERTDVVGVYSSEVRAVSTIAEFPSERSTVYYVQCYAVDVDFDVALALARGHAVTVGNDGVRINNTERARHDTHMGDTATVHRVTKRGPDSFEALGEVTEAGALQMFDRDHMIRWIQSMQPGTYVVSLKKLRNKRSSAQNRYLHGCLIPLFAEHCGYDFDDMKDALALELLPKEVIDVKTGEVKIVPGHTSQLTTKEFEEFCERARRLGDSMGIYVPEPNEVGYDVG